MKTILIIASLFTLGFAQAQEIKEADVPSKVKAGFAKKYPSAKVEKWEKEGTDYEAEFKIAKVESSAVFDANGNFKEVEKEIKTTELPKAVANYCAKTYAGYKLTEAAKITDAAGKVMFEAEMTKGKEHFDALFDEKGGFIKKSAPAKESEEEKD